MYLSIDNNQYIILQSINSSHSDRKIHAIKSTSDNWIIGDYLLSDCNNPDDTWYNWKDWLLSLPATNETPKPRPQNKRPNK